MRRTGCAFGVKPVAFGSDTTVFNRMSVWDLLRSMVVFRTCAIRPFVRNSRRLLALSSTVLGERLTYDVLVRRTVFNQFCAGADEVEIKPVLKILSEQGVDINALGHNVKSPINKK